MLTSKVRLMMHSRVMQKEKCKVVVGAALTPIPAVEFYIVDKLILLLLLLCTGNSLLPLTPPRGGVLITEFNCAVFFSIHFPANLFVY